jgi:hypothetical protein
MHPICLLFGAHRTDDFTLAQFAAYSCASPGLCDAVFLLHLPAEPLPRLPEPALALDDAAIFDGVPCLKAQARRVVPGGTELKLLAAMERLPPYAHFLFVEYDVLALGDLRATMAALIAFAEGVDLAGSFLRSATRSPEWMWWSSLIPPPGVRLAPEARHRAFLPVAVYSRPFLIRVREALLAGWQGHHEALLPTLASSHGMVLKDLNRHRPRFTAMPQFGVHAPAGLDAAKLPRFIHPVKDFSQYQALPEAIRAGGPLER